MKKYLATEVQLRVNRRHRRQRSEAESLSSSRASTVSPKLTYIDIFRILAQTEDDAAVKKLLPRKLQDEQIFTFLKSISKDAYELFDLLHPMRMDVGEKVRAVVKRFLLNPKGFKEVLKHLKSDAMTSERFFELIFQKEKGYNMYRDRWDTHYKSLKAVFLGCHLNTTVTTRYNNYLSPDAKDRIRRDLLKVFLDILHTDIKDTKTKLRLEASGQDTTLIEDISWYLFESGQYILNSPLESVV